MSDPVPPQVPPSPPPLLASNLRSGAQDEKVICERCAKAEMYRMHAVWRCPECGYKTDCCGW